MEKENKKEEKSIMQKFEKPIIFTLFFLAISLFVFSLIFMTPFYGLYIVDGPFLKGSMETFNLSVDSYPVAYQYLKNTTVLGLNMGAFTSFTRNELQSTNHLMFYLGFAGILIGAAMFVFFSQKRKIYYLSNYITVGLSSIYNIVCGIIVFSHLSTWINYINTRVDFNTINAYQSSLNNKTEIIEYFKASDYTYIFVIGFIICALLVIAGLIGIGFIVTRILYQKKHKGLDLSEVKIND